MWSRFGSPMWSLNVVPNFVIGLAHFKQCCQELKVWPLIVLKRGSLESSKVWSLCGTLLGPQFPPSPPFGFQCGPQFGFQFGAQFGPEFGSEFRPQFDSVF